MEKYEKSSSDGENPWLKESLFDDVEFSGGNGAEKEVKVELPDSSPDFDCKAMLRTIDRCGNKEKLKSYVEDMLGRSFAEYASIDDFTDKNPGFLEKTRSSVTNSDAEALREYSGYNYKYINSVLRGFWYYELLGPKTEAAEERYRETASVMERAIQKAPAIGRDMMVFRGTNLDAFKKYRISSLDELDNMKGQFYLERGFTSTSIVEDSSFAGRESFDDPLRKACNIEMRYKIPEGCKDGIMLIGEPLAYSKTQDEYVINNFSLAYIDNVEVDKENNSAVIDCILVPRGFYDRMSDASNIKIRGVTEG